MNRLVRPLESRRSMSQVQVDGGFRKRTIVDRLAFYFAEDHHCGHTLIVMIIDTFFVAIHFPKYPRPSHSNTFRVNILYYTRGAIGIRRRVVVQVFFGSTSVDRQMG